MSSINQKYTFSYSQPAEYHFSHDSVFLAQFVFEYIQQNNNTEINSVADLCAGCGVIGLDLLCHMNKNKMTEPTSIDFIEVQEIYQKHFTENTAELKKLIQTSTVLNFVNKNYESISDQLGFKSKYDLIACNPPYFNKNQGKLSPSDFKNRCRFFMDSDFFNLMKSIQFSLALKGNAFILLRSLRDHKQSHPLVEVSAMLGLSSVCVGQIRGTDVIQICHNEGKTEYEK
jgi:tRNA1Val (adenine37-N6)-methyltransferase